MTIRPKIRVLFIYLFIICTRQFHLINVLINLFILFVDDHSTNYMFVFLWFIFPFCTTIRPKIRSSLISFFVFVHDHSTKVRCHSYFLIYSFLNCANISFAILTADTAFIFRTLYLWKSCCYISYAISMAIWSHVFQLSRFERGFLFWEDSSCSSGPFWNLKFFKSVTLFTK